MKSLRVAGTAGLTMLMLGSGLTSVAASGQTSAPIPPVVAPPAAQVRQHGISVADLKISGGDLSMVVDWDPELAKAAGDSQARVAGRIRLQVRDSSNQVVELAHWEKNSIPAGQQKLRVALPDAAKKQLRAASAATLSVAQLRGSASKANPVTRYRKAYVATVRVKADRGGISMLPAKRDCSRQLLGAGAKLAHCDFSGAALANLQLANAHLGGADLTGAQLTGAGLGQAELKAATLTGASLAGANLGEADLTSANLRSADLTNSSLQGVNAHGVKVGGANLTGAQSAQRLLGDDTPVSAVYWQDPATNNISVSYVSGNTVINTIKDFITGIPAQIGSIAAAGRNIYWTYRDANWSTTIGRATLLQTLAVDSVKPSFLPVPSVARAIAVDGFYIYWTTDARTVARARLDGSDFNPAFISNAGDSPGAIAVSNYRILWVNGGGSKQIARAALDGSKVNLSYGAYGDSIGSLGSEGNWVYAGTRPSGTDTTYFNRGDLYDDAIRNSRSLFSFSPSGPFAATYPYIYSAGGSAIGQVRQNQDGLVAGSSFPNLIPTGFQAGVLAASAKIPAALSIGSVAPDAGPRDGGTQIRIFGAGFRQGASAQVGGVNCVVKEVSADGSSLTCTTGAHPIGFADVAVANPDTTIATLRNGFAYTPSDQLYWAAGGKIGRSGTDGGQPVMDLIPTVRDAVDVAIEGKYLYWTAGTSNAIGRATLTVDGGVSDVQSRFITANVVNPLGLTVAGYYLYWINGVDHNIYRSRVDGSATTWFANHGTDSSNRQLNPFDIVTNSTDVYWTADANDPRFNSGYLGTALLNGGSAMPDLPGTALKNPKGLAQAGEYLYWADPSANAIGRGHAVNHHVEPVDANFIPNQSRVAAVATDSKYLYWTSAGDDSHSRVNRMELSSSQRTTDLVTAIPGDVSGMTVGHFPALSPLINSVSPDTGSAQGGTEVTIKGGNFEAGAAVAIGGNDCADVGFVDDSTLTCRTPSHAAGSVNINVLNPDGQVAVLAGAFTYQGTRTLYWAENGRIGRSVGGSGAQYLNNAGDVVDVVAVGGYLYWSHRGAAGSGDGAGIGRARIETDGSLSSADPRYLDFKRLGIPGDPAGIAVTGFYVYVAIPGSGAIYRFDLVSEQAKMIFSGTQEPEHLTTSGQYLMWTDRRGGAIWRSQLDGTLAAKISDAESPQALAAAGGVLYYGNQPKIPLVGISLSYLGQAGIQDDGTLTGNNSNWLRVQGPAPKQAVITGVAAGQDYLYWTSGLAADGTAAEHSGQIQQVRLDGTGIATVLSGLNDPRGIAFQQPTGPAPTIGAISPNQGTQAGGTTVVITGSNFVQGATARIGGIDCQSTEFVDPATLRCVTGRSGIATKADVVVKNPDTQGASVADGFEYTGFANTYFWPDADGCIRSAGAVSASPLCIFNPDGSKLKFLKLVMSNGTLWFLRSGSDGRPVPAIGSFSVDSGGHLVMSSLRSSAITLSQSPVAFDVNGNYVYWITAAGAIGRAAMNSLDNPEQQFATNLGIDTSDVARLSLFGYGNYLYWTSYRTGEVAQFNIATKRVQPGFITGGSKIGVTIMGDQVWWVNANGDSGSLWRADLSTDSKEVKNATQILTLSKPPLSLTSSDNALLWSQTDQTIWSYDSRATRIVPNLVHSGNDMSTTAGPGSLGATSIESPTPAINTIDQTSGPMAGGTSLTISGTALDRGVSVSLGGSPCLTTTVSGDGVSLTCVTTAHNYGPVDVVAMNAYGKSSTMTSGFRYVVGQSLYWPNGSSIGRAAANGSDANPNALGVSARSVAATESHVYWATSDSKNIGRATVADDGKLTDADSHFISTPGVRAVAVGGDSLFWETSDSSRCQIYRANIDDPASAQPFAQCSLYSNNYMLVYGDYLYWIDGPNQITRERLDGGKPEPFASGVDHMVFEMAGAGNKIYWAAGNAINQYSGYVGATDITTKQTSKYVTGNIELRGPLVVTSDYLFWGGIERDSGQMTIHRQKLDGSDKVINAIPAANQAQQIAASTLPGGPLSVSRISPNSGSANGGDTLMVSGSGFVDGMSIQIGGTICSMVRVINSGSAQCVTNAHTAGVVDVVANVPGGKSAPLMNGFTYRDKTFVYGTSEHGKIWRSTVDGSSVVKDFVPGVTTARSVVTFDRYLYWQDNDGIHRVYLDGTGPVDLVKDSGDANSGAGLATDGNYLYWASAQGGGRIGRAAIDGGGANSQFASVSDKVNQLAVDQKSSSLLASTSTQVSQISIGDGSLKRAVQIVRGTGVAASNGVAYYGNVAAGRSVPVIGRWDLSTGESRNEWGQGSGTDMSLAMTADTLFQLQQNTVGAIALAAGPLSTSSRIYLEGEPSTSITVSLNSLPAPLVTAVSPDSGPAAGGTEITVTGANFATGAVVKVGSTECPVKPGTLSATELVCTTGAFNPGKSLIMVTNPDTQVGFLFSRFSYLVATPTVTAIVPNTGSVRGGEQVQITGTGFDPGQTSLPTREKSSVFIGGAECVDVHINSGISGTKIMCTTTAAAHGGPADVTVVNHTAGGDLTGTMTAGYSYLNATPSIVSITPANGVDTGGTEVKIAGTAFADGATVSIGGSDCSVSALTATQLTCVTSQHTAGFADVVVSAPYANLAVRASGFQYLVPPAVRTIDPVSGPSGGGTPVTISGAGFVAGITSARIGGVGCSDARVVSSNILTCVTGPSRPGAAQDVTVTVGYTSALLNQAFTYTSTAYSFGGITPVSGAMSGGTLITVSGDGLADGMSLTIGDQPCHDWTLVSSVKATCVTSAHPAGQVDVVVSGPSGERTTLPGGFSYTSYQPAQMYLLSADGNSISAVQPDAADEQPTTKVLAQGSAINAQPGKLIASDNYLLWGQKGGGVARGQLAGSPQTGSLVDITSKYVDTTGLPANVAALTGGAGWFGMEAVSRYSNRDIALIGLYDPAGPAKAAPKPIVPLTGFDTPSNVIATSWTYLRAPGGTATIYATGTGTQTIYRLQQTDAYKPRALVTGLDYVPTGLQRYGDYLYWQDTGNTTLGRARISGDDLVDVQPHLLNISGLDGHVVSGHDPVWAVDGTYLYWTNYRDQSVGRIALTGQQKNPSFIDQFAYPTVPDPQPQLRIDSVSPNTGPAAGGTSITLSGSGLTADSTVTVGGQACTAVAESSGQLTCQTQAHEPGAADVVVTRPDSRSATLAGGFGYAGPAPTVANIAPPQGPLTGNTKIGIAGTGFVRGIKVKIGSQECSRVNALAATSLECWSPPASAVGTVDVTVTNPDGQQVVVPQAFSYQAGSTVAWANIDGQSIVTAGMDGGVDPAKTIDLSGIDAYPYDVEFAGGYVYWTDVINDCIGRAKADGSNQQQCFISDGISSPSGMTIASTDAGSYLYWVNSTGSIGAAQLNGDGPATNVTPDLIPDLVSPVDVVFAANTLYWTDAQGGPQHVGAIGKASLDNPLTVVSGSINRTFLTDGFTASGANGPAGLAVGPDPNLPTLYWTNSASSTIGRADLSAAGPQNVNQAFVTGPRTPMGIAVDDGEIYWTNAQSADGGTGSIGRAPVDGQGASQIDWVTSGVDQPRGVTIHSN